MESGYDNSDTKQTHRIEMLMLAILVQLQSLSICQRGPVWSNRTIISSSSSLPTSTSSVAGTTSLSPSYLLTYADILCSYPANGDGPHFLPTGGAFVDDNLRK